MMLAGVKLKRKHEQMNEDKHPFTSMHHMIKASNTVMLWDMYENPVNSGFVLRWWKEKIKYTSLKLQSERLLKQTMNI